jgi:anti-sigma-K factor RskA
MTKFWQNFGLPNHKEMNSESIKIWRENVSGVAATAVVAVASSHRSVRSLHFQELK